MLEVVCGPTQIHQQIQRSAVRVCRTWHCCQLCQCVIHTHEQAAAQSCTTPPFAPLSLSPHSCVCLHTAHLPAILDHIPDKLHHWRLPLDQADRCSIHQLLVWRRVRLTGVCCLVPGLVIVLHPSCICCCCCGCTSNDGAASAAAGTATAAAAASCCAAGFESMQSSAVLREHHPR